MPPQRIKGARGLRLPPDLDVTARVGVTKAGQGGGKRRTVNLVEGVGVALALADDAQNERVTVTVSVSGFVGHVAKDHDPADQAYPKGATVTLVTYDVGPSSHLILFALRLPPVVNAALRTRALLTYSDQSTSFHENANTTNPWTANAQGEANAIMGDAINGAAAQRDGLRLQKIAFQVRNTDAQNDITVDLAPFMVRAQAVPAGGGAVTTT